MPPPRPRNLFWYGIIFITFAGGLVIGAYYSQDILVWWRAVTNSQTISAPLVSSLPGSPSITSPSPVSRATTLSMPQLTEPLPLIYSDTLEETILQQYLQQGAVVLPLGTVFGGPGNVVVTAHSSGTKAFGPYRFAFTKLGELETGDEFAINTKIATYHYRVYGSEIVWPHQVDKLPQGDRSTVTLVTCWPIWTNLKRLLVHAELFSTDYKI